MGRECAELNLVLCIVSCEKDKSLRFGWGGVLNFEDDFGSLEISGGEFRFRSFSPLVFSQLRSEIRLLGRELIG